MIGEGRSYLTVPVAQALPAPPDVAAEGSVPGGKLVACTPKSLAVGQSIQRRTNYALNFDGIRGEITRLAFSVPVFLQELELEKQSIASTEETLYKTEEEATHATEGIGGLSGLSVQTVPLGLNQRYEQTEDKLTGKHVAAGGKFVSERDQVTLRSVLPIDLTIVARINGPDGALWSDSFDVPVHYVQGAAGAAFGVGTLEQYVDLTNPLPIDCEKVYGLEFLVFVPTAVPSNTQLGAELAQGPAAAPGEGSATVYYEFETGSANK